MTRVRSALKSFRTMPIAGLILFFAAVDFAGAAPLATGGCVPTATRYKVGGANTQSTTTGEFENVIDTGIVFVQGGTNPSCVVISFSAEARIPASAPTSMLVRPVLDGTTFCDPGFVFFVEAPTAAGMPGAARAMTFVCEDVMPGRHTIKMQFRSTNAVSVTLGARTTVVHFVR